jgi:hypothetical protein
MQGIYHVSVEVGFALTEDEAQAILPDGAPDAPATLPIPVARCQTARVRGP